MHIYIRFSSSFWFFSFKQNFVFYRWHNHLDPAINKEAWSEKEEAILSYYHQIYGNKWADIAKFLPGRYDFACMVLQKKE